MVRAMSGFPVRLLACLVPFWLPAAALAQPQAPRAPAPILAGVVPAGRVAPEVVAAAEAALVEQLTAMSGGRPVQPIATEIAAAIAACRDDACIGAALAGAGGQAGAILRLSIRRGRVAARLELVDPVSGAARMAPVEGELPREAAGVPQALAALTAQLQGAMPAPPPPPATLLVTVSEDGAAVRIDGQEIGTSPVAAVEVSEGAHEVVVVRSGFMGFRRRVEVRAGEQARLDVTLEAMTAHAAAVETAPEGSEGGWTQPGPARGPEVYEEWWFWTVIGASAAAIVAITIGIAVAASSGGPADPQGIPLPPIVTP